jgi:hypothetical protein
VRCLDDAFPRCIHDWCDSLPLAGKVYTIRGLQLGSDPTTGVFDLGLLLAEIVNPRKANGAEAGFFHTRFVPWLDAEAASSFASEPLELQGVP